MNGVSQGQARLEVYQTGTSPLGGTAAQFTSEARGVASLVNIATGNLCLFADSGWAIGGNQTDDFS